MFSNPYIRIALVILLSTISEMFLKRGALDTAHLPHMLDWLGFNALRSGWVWIGILVQILGFAGYAAVLRVMPLSLAFGLMSILHVTIPVFSRIFFHETIPPLRWAGIWCVLLGVLVLARPVSVLEEKA